METEVRIPARDATLDGHLTVPRDARCMVLFVHGSGSSRHSLNREAMAQMRCNVKLELIPGATHLFEEPGALEAVANLARAWFTQHLSESTR